MIELAFMAVLGTTLASAPSSPVIQEQEAARDTIQEQKAARDTLPEPADTLPRYRTEEISVTVTRAERLADRVPYALAALGEVELQSAERGASLADALWRVPGVFAQDRRNFALGDRIAVRGAGARAQFGVRGIRVLLDGIPLTLPDGQTTLENLDLAGIGRAEAIRGPAAALYGNAAAGVLSFQTERPADGAFVAEPRLVAGSHSWREARLQASGRAGELEYLVGGSRLTTDGFREYSAAEIYRGTAVVARPFSGGGEARLLLNAYRAPFSENPGSLSLDDAQVNPRHARPAQIAQGTGKETTQVQAGLTLDLPTGEAHRLTATVWGVRRDVWNPIPGTIIDLGRYSGGLRGEFAGERSAAGRPLRWVTGMDLELQQDDRVEHENLGVPETQPEGEDSGRAQEGERLLDQEERVLGFGPFLQAEWEVARGWTVSAAGRLDVYRFSADDRRATPTDQSGTRAFRRFSPMAGLTWSPRPNLHLFANLTTAFQTPTTSELSNRPDGAGGFHPELGPETTVSTEVGVRGSLADARVGYAVSAFRARVRDALVPFEGAAGEVFFRNAGEVERRGLEASAAWLPGAGLELEANYTRHRARFDTFRTDQADHSGNEEPGVPDHVVALAARHSAPFGLRSELRFRWVDDYPVDDANSAFNPSHRVVDLRLSLQDGTGPFRPFLGIDNLFDERYNGSVVPNAFGGRYFEPAPGREVFGGLSVTFPSGAGDRRER